MENKDYFEYISKKPFDEQLRAFGQACESTVRNSYQAAERGVGDENRQWYSSESKAQSERANWLFAHLIEEHEKGEQHDSSTVN